MITSEQQSNPIFDCPASRMVCDSDVLRLRLLRDGVANFGVLGVFGQIDAGENGKNFVKLSSDILLIEKLGKLKLVVLKI